MTRCYRFRVFRDKRGKWRWAAFSLNGRQVAESGQGYARKAHAERMLVRLFGAWL